MSPTLSHQSVPNGWVTGQQMWTLSTSIAETAKTIHYSIPIRITRLNMRQPPKSPMYSFFNLNLHSNVDLNSKVSSKNIPKQKKTQWRLTVLRNLFNIYVVFLKKETVSKFCRVGDSKWSINQTNCQNRLFDDL